MNPSADRDGDGRCEKQEMLAGTDPNAADSRMEFSMGFSNSGVRIHFSPLMDTRTYSVDRSGSLVDSSWTTLTNGTLETLGRSASVFDNPDSMGIYRVTIVASNAASISASSFEDEGGEYHPPQHAYDGDTGSRWSAEGTNEWIQFVFPVEQIFNTLQIVFHNGNTRVAYFSAESSDHGLSWFSFFDGESSGVSTLQESFLFNTVTSRWFRIAGHGNSASDWNSFNEIKWDYVVPDMEPPTVPGNVQAITTSAYSATVSWDASSDNIGVVGYRVFRNGSLVSTRSAAQLSYPDSGLNATTTYTYVISAFDAAGNPSSNSAPAYVTTGEALPVPTFYVSSSLGNDANDGASTNAAWATIAKVNEQNFEPGTRVLFRRGDTWRETLEINESGTQDAYITFGVYGEGEKPRILGSVRAVGWELVAGMSNIWRAGNAMNEPMSPGYGSHPASIFFGEQDGSTTWGKIDSLSSTPDPGLNFSNLQAEYDWCWQADHIYVYCTQNPDSQYTFIEVPQRDAAIRMITSPPQEFIEIDGIEMMYTIKAGYDDGWPMDYEVSGLNIKNCHIGYIGVPGAASAMGLQIWHSDMLVQNNDIHDSGRRNISYNVYVDNGRHNSYLVFSNVVFEGNTLHSGFHTTGFDISGGDNSGGIYFYDTFINFTFRNNLVYDNPADDPEDTPNDWSSMGIYLNAEAATFANFKVYNNIISYPKQKGLIVGNVDNAEIYNNVFYGMNDRAGGSGYRSIVSINSGSENLKFYNNIVYGTVMRSNYLSRNVLISGSDNEIAGMDNNLYYQDDPNQRMFDNPYGSYNVDDWGPYVTQTPWDQNSPQPADPLFIDPANNDFRLQSTNSPAYNAGIPVPWILTDFNGNPRDPDHPCIGAFELGE